MEACPVGPHNHSTTHSRTHARTHARTHTRALTRTHTTPCSPRNAALQEWWGVTPQILSHAERIAAKGYSVIVPDLYRGKAGTVVW
jgi:dienelactone hydrolase